MMRNFETLIEEANLFFQKKKLHNEHINFELVYNNFLEINEYLNKNISTVDHALTTTLINSLESTEIYINDYLYFFERLLKNFESSNQANKRIVKTIDILSKMQAVNCDNMNLLKQIATNGKI